MSNKEEAPAAEESDEVPAKKGKKKLIIIVAVVALLAIGGAVFALMGGKKTEGKHEAATEEHADDGHGKEAKKDDGHGGGHGEESAAPAVANAPAYYELPEFLVNLNSGTGRVSFLKMSVTLELKDKSLVPLMDANKPRIQDTFVTYLRELKPSDIQGSAGIFRLRDELMGRLNGTIEEGAVKDILFKEIIVQ